MKTLIAFRTKYGTTAACARALAEKIGGQTALADIADSRDIDVREYDAVLIGGSIYAGRIQRGVVAFCERNRTALLQRKVGLFVCSLYQGEYARVQMQNAFPDWLLAHAFARALPGGELHRAQLSFLDRLLVRAVGNEGRDVSLLKLEVLDEMVAALKSLGS